MTRSRLLRTIGLAWPWCLPILLASWTLGADESTSIATAPGLFCVSPKGDQLMAVRTAAPHKIEVWDFSQRELIATLEDERQDAFSCLACSADGAAVVAATTSGRILHWETASGRRVEFYDDTSRARQISWIRPSPDGAVVAWFDEAEPCLMVWDRNGGTTKSSIQGSGQHRLSSFTADNRILTVVFADQVWQWDRATGKAHQKLAPSEEFVVQRAVASSDGRVVAAVTNLGVEVWDTGKLERGPALEYDQDVQPVFTSDDKRLLCVRDAGTQCEIDVWDHATGTNEPEFRKTISGMIGKVLTVSPAGGLAAFPGEDGSVIRWGNLDSGEFHVLGKPGQFGEDAWPEIRGLAFSHDGRRIAASGRDVVRVWDVDSAQVVGQLRIGNEVERLWFDKTGHTLATLDVTGNLRLFDPGSSLTPIPHRTYDFSTEAGYADGFKGLDFTPDGRKLALALSSRRVVLMDTAMGKELRSIKVDANLLGFSQDGRKLLLVSRSNTYVYDMDTDTLTEASRRNQVASDALGERLVCGRLDRKIALWNPRSGGVVQFLQPGAVADVMSGLEAVSPDAKKYAILSGRKAGDGSIIEVMDIRAARTISSIPLDTLGVDSWCRLNFSPDGSELLLATSGPIAVIDYRKKEVKRVMELRPSKDGQALARAIHRRPSVSINFNPVTERPAPLTHLEDVDSMAVSLTGVLATASADGYVDLWDYRTGRFIETIANKGSKTNHLSFSPDGSRLAYVQEKTLHIVDVSQIVPSGGSKEVETAAPSREDRRDEASRLQE